MKLEVYVSDTRVLKKFPAWLRNAYQGGRGNPIVPGERILSFQFPYTRSFETWIRRALLSHLIRTFEAEME